MTDAVATPDSLSAALAIPSTRAPSRSGWSATSAAFRAMVLRDLVVLGKNFKRFLPTAIVQPALLVFVFTFIFPHIAQGVGGQAGAARFATLLLPGVVANSIIFVGIFSVGMNVILEMDADEFEDRVLAPASIMTAAVAKIGAGSLQALFAGVVVFPIALFLPSTSVALHANWLVLVTIVPLACITAASLGLALGTAFKPQSGPWLLGVVALPVSFFGAVFYTWESLAPIPVFQHAVLANPLVYMSEGLRAALVGGVPHMSLVVVYLALAGFATLFVVLGLIGFRRHMLT